MEFGTGNMGEESASDVDKEDTFVAGSQDLAQKLRDRVDAKLSGQEEKSVWEKYLDKRKEKKRAHKERMFVYHSLLLPSLVFGARPRGTFFLGGEL